MTELLEGSKAPASVAEEASGNYQSHLRHVLLAGARSVGASCHIDQAGARITEGDVRSLEQRFVPTTRM
jgi:hypothetical protein